MNGNYEQRRAELFADMAALFEFFSYDIQPTLERFIQAARHIQEFDEHALVVLTSSNELRTYLSPGLSLSKTEGLELADFYPGESALYIVDEVNERTQNVIFPSDGPVRSYALIPLITQNDVIGLLILGCLKPTAFEEEAQDLFFSLGSHLAVAMENIRHYERSQERLRVLVSLQESHRAIASVEDIDGILAKIAEEGMKTLGVATMAIYLLDDAGGLWERRIFRSRVPAVPGPARVPLPDLPAQLAQALEANEVRTIVTGGEPMGPFPFSPRFPVGVMVPLRGGDALRGFCLMETGRIDGDREYLIQLFAGQVRVLFANAMLVQGLREKTRELEHSTMLIREYAENLQRSNEQLENRVRELTTLHDVSDALDSRTSLDQVLEYILERACGVMRADKGSLLLLEDDQLHARCTRGITDPAPLVFGLGEGVAGWVAKTGQPRIIENIQRDSRFKRRAGGLDREETMLSVPLSLDNRVIGVLNVDRELKFGVFTPEEERVLMSLASAAAQALERAQHIADLRTLHLETLEAFAQAVDTKDAYTHGHSRRVSYMSVQVARMLRLPEDEVDIIARAGLLHDVGKIGITNAILFKPGKLTDEEYEIMKAHSVFGENILKPIKRMAAEARLIRHHHERWDGRGYPDGLRGEAIPLGSAIICVCDAYDTMTSDRPYRRSLGKEYALEELNKCSGQQFNPLVVGAFTMVASRRDFAEGAGSLALATAVAGLGAAPIAPASGLAG